jgi:hypothetical protein
MSLFQRTAQSLVAHATRRNPTEVVTVGKRVWSNVLNKLIGLQANLDVLLQTRLRAREKLYFRPTKERKVGKVV